MNKKSKNKSFKMSKDEKIRMLLEYARECYKKGHKPSKGEIRRKFNLEIYNYFKNIADYHEKAGIKLSLRNYPKEKAKEVIISCLQDKAKEEIYPNRKEIEKTLNIHFSTYFKNLKELYDSAKIDYYLAQREIKTKVSAPHTHSYDTLNNQKNFIRKFIQENVSKGIYPSVQHIQKELNLSFYNLYNDIFEAYEDAGISYNRVSPIILGKKKEEIFTKIIKELLQKIGFTIKRISIESEINFNRHADMIIEDKQGRVYLVEIKAYRKDYYISKREFEQLLKYLIKEKISNGIFITTSNAKRCSFNDIKFINGEEVIKLLKEYKLSKHIELIEWVQESRINSKELENHRDKIKNKIINYIRTKETIPTKKEIQRVFKIDLRTAFGKINPYANLLEEIKIK
ncbi:MAG: restriction endonuclease [archaeon]